MCHMPVDVCQLQTSALQPSLDKLFAGIRRKVVPFFMWFGIVTKMVFGSGETCYESNMLTAAVYSHNNCTGTE
jgi:hypothetical protein